MTIYLQLRTFPFSFSVNCEFIVGMPFQSQKWDAININEERKDPFLTESPIKEVVCVDDVVKMRKKSLMKNLWEKNTKIDFHVFLFLFSSKNKI